MNKSQVLVWICLFCVINVLFGSDTSTERCDSQYQLTDNYGTEVFNVTIKQEECDIQHYNLSSSLEPGHFKLSIQRTNEERKLSLVWGLTTTEYYADNVEFFIKVVLMFDNNYIIHDNNQQCLRVKATSLSNEKSPVNNLQLGINCLKAPLDGVGVLHVYSRRLIYQEDKYLPVTETTHDVFNIGCSFSKTIVTLGGKYLDVRFQHLSFDTDLELSTVQISGPNKWKHSTNLTESGFGFGMTEVFISLPVNEPGKYKVKVELVCNTHGDINRRIFMFTKIVRPEILKPTTGLPVEADTTDDQNDLAWILVTIACVLGIIIAVVIFYVCHRRTELFSRRQPVNNMDGVSDPLQSPT